MSRGAVAALYIFACATESRTRMPGRHDEVDTHPPEKKIFQTRPGLNEKQDK